MLLLSERLRNSDLHALRKWKLKVDDTKEKILTHEGEDEMIDLAERLQIRFPSLLPSTYSNTTFYVNNLDYNSNSVFISSYKFICSLNTQKVKEQRLVQNISQLVCLVVNLLEMYGFPHLRTKIRF